MGIPGTNLPSPGKSKPKSGITCTNCKTSYQTEFIFCPNCGSNLTLPREIDLSDISFRDTVDEKYFDYYEQMQQKIKEFDWLESAVKQQEQVIESLKVEIKRIKLDIDSLNEQIKMQKRDVEELEKLTWKSFKVKISGKHAEVLKKEEEEYLNVIQNLEVSREELIRTEEKLKNAVKDKEKLMKGVGTRNTLIAKSKEIIFKATHGIRDPVEDKIEMSINDLVKEIDPYTVKKSRIQTAYSFLQVAQENLRNATIIVAEETEEKTVQKNALLMDILTKSEVSEIKSVVKEATSYINQAYEILSKEIGDGEDLDGDGRHMGLFEGQGLWEKFMRSFMRDMKSGFRNKEETRVQLTKSVGEVNKLLSWLNSLLNEMNVIIDDFMEKLRGLELDLINERKRIFQNLYQQRGQ